MDPDLSEKNESIIVQKKQVKWYNLPMKKNVLSQTNPYVRDKKQRLSGLIISVGSSSAIEGIPPVTPGLGSVMAITAR